jgi:hypothetical protein
MLIFIFLLFDIVVRGLLSLLIKYNWKSKIEPFLSFPFHFFFGEIISIHPLTHLEKHPKIINCLHWDLGRTQLREQYKQTNKLKERKERDRHWN